MKKVPENTVKDDREARLAKALRANLARRKQQARAPEPDNTAGPVPVKGAHG